MAKKKKEEYILYIANVNFHSVTGWNEEREGFGREKNKTNGRRLKTENRMAVSFPREQGKLQTLVDNFLTSSDVTSEHLSLSLSLLYMST